MTTVSSFAAALAVAACLGCGCGLGTTPEEPEPTLLERLRADASGMDLFHGTATRGEDCVLDPDPYRECSDVHRVAGVAIDVDWAPDGTYLPPDAPTFEGYGIGLPGDFPVKGPGYISAYRWDALEGAEVTITCGSAVIADGHAHTMPVLAASDEEVAESGFTHAELRGAIQEATINRVTEAAIGQIGGCPGGPETHE